MKLTRRFFLRSSGAVAAFTWLTPVDALAQVVDAGKRAAVASRRKTTLVVVFLRGGIDGLNLVVPHGEAEYYRLRNWLAVPRPGAKNGAVELDGFFGLHPWAEELAPLFRSGSAVALHAVGYSQNTRSHFEEQDVWETGVVGNTLAADGWLNRHLASSEGHGPVRAISIGDTLPRILRGKVQTLALRGLSDLTFSSDSAGMASAVEALERAYRPGGEQEAGARGLLRRGGRATLDAVRELQQAASQPYETSIVYPDTEFGRRMREAARIIKADVGVELCEIDFGGWDTHQNQGAIGGPYSNLVRQLSGGLSAFANDLDGRMDDVLVLTLSEFGRTAAMNGTGGTDHGWANCMLALGGPVLRAGSGKPRMVLGEWPGLARENLHQARDLAHTTDFRDIFAEVVRKHLDNPAIGTVLPGYRHEPVGLL